MLAFTRMLLLLAAALVAALTAAQCWSLSAVASAVATVIEPVAIEDAALSSGGSRVFAPNTQISVSAAVKEGRNWRISVDFN